MAVVRNLMIRIGADYSAAQKGMQGATRELGRFKRDTQRTTSSISGRKGFAGISTEMKNLGGQVTASLSRIRGAKGVGGVVSELKNLRPLLGTTTKGLAGLGGSAAGVGAAFGSAALGVTAFVAILGVASVGLYHASQAAVKYEADLGRLNMQLKGGSREFLNWARAQGLAKQSAVEMGATYGTLISSFVKDTGRLKTETAALVQATRVTASATGRPIEDVMERMRSGLLGNTEAIEDLGIFVNVAMIESTDAFKKFAGDKSWDKLNFQTQQQIRLAAILEQTYKRYGNELQNNVMTKQTELMEQLKDIKLNLSQAFLPIWDSVLPALQALARDVAFVTEKVARFMYMLRGWDYDEMTSGTDQQTDAVVDQGSAYDDLAKQAKAARKEIAAFDQLNLIGQSGGSGGGSGGGGGAGGGLPGGGNQGNSPNLPQYPPMNGKKWRLEFDTPNPPDAGAGAVATVVTSTINGMIASARSQVAQMWEDLRAQGLTGSLAQQLIWNGFSEMLVSTIFPAMRVGTVFHWRSMWEELQASTVTGVADLKLQWTTLKNEVQSITNPLTVVKIAWKETLSSMQQNLNAYRPYLEWGWQLIRVSVKNLNPSLSEVKQSWKSTLESMYADAVSNFGGIVAAVNNTISAFNRLKQAISGANASPAPAPITPQAPSAIPRDNWSVGWSPPEKQTSMDIIKNNFETTLSPDFYADAWSKLLEEANKPLNKTAFGVYSTIVPAGKISSLFKGAAGKAMDIWDWLKTAGGAVPAFATGAVVSGPTLAMVGDNRNAAIDPEVISPLSTLEDMIDGGSDPEMIVVLRQILQAVREGKSVQAVISRDAVGRAAVDYHNDTVRRTGRTPLTI